VIYVGTVGEGLWGSDDDGETWAPEPGLPPDARIYSLAVSLDDRLYVGARGVLYRRDGRTWNALPLPDPELQVWALGVHPLGPSVVLAGCRPLALLETEDDGKRWWPLGLALPPGTLEPHTSRVTAILFDRAHPEKVWAGVEVGGVFEARGRGPAAKPWVPTWVPINDGLPSLDIHALALAADGAILAATPRGVAVYERGRWAPAVSDSPDRYFRALASKPGEPATLYAGLGDGPPGTRGTVLISTDSGRHWAGTRFPGATSTVWSIATGPREPGLVVAAAIMGEVFVSRDAGRSWARASRSFAEIRAVACAS
jgi:photosystem II stability/assembly factor-like uncharacterized protein